MSVSEIITDGGRRRHWGAAEKLRIVEETLDGRDSISVVARRNGVAPNLLYRWRQLMLEGGSVAVTGDDDVTSNRQVREMENRIRVLPWPFRLTTKRNDRDSFDPRRVGDSFCRTHCRIARPRTNGWMRWRRNTNMHCLAG